MFHRPSWTDVVRALEILAFLGLIIPYVIIAIYMIRFEVAYREWYKDLVTISFTAAIVFVECRRYLRDYGRPRANLIRYYFNKPKYEISLVFTNTSERLFFAKVVLKIGNIKLTDVSVPIKAPEPDEKKKFFEGKVIVRPREIVDITLIFYVKEGIKEKLTEERERVKKAKVCITYEPEGYEEIEIPLN